MKALRSIVLAAEILLFVTALLLLGKVYAVYLLPHVMQLVNLIK